MIAPFKLTHLGANAHATRRRQPAHTRKVKAFRTAALDFLSNHIVMTIRVALAVVLGVVAPIIAVTLSPSWLPNYSAADMRISTAFAILLPAALAFLVSLSSEDWGGRVANAICVPVLSGWLAYMMPGNNPYSTVEGDIHAGYVLAIICAIAGLAGAVIGELVPRHYMCDLLHIDN